MPEESLRDITLKGTAWSAVDNIASYAVSFVVGIVLARLLTPEDYGLIGIIAIFTTVCTTIINGGFSTALIRKKDCTDDDFNTSFIVNFVLSLMLYGVIFICSPMIAGFFEKEQLVSLARVSSLSMIVGALAIVQQTRLTKRIDFKTQTKVSLISSITSGVVGISMALVGFGVWSLVAQGLVAQIMKTIFLWIYNKWVPSLRFSMKSFKELFGFGWKMMASGVLDSTWTQLYQVVVGKFYSPTTLGQYTRANQFSQLFSSNLTSVIQRVTFPVLSNIQDEKERMVVAYRRIIKLTMFITFTGMFALGAVSEPLLFCLIGEKWHEAATYLPLICLIGAFYPLHAINLNMLQVQGRSDLFLFLEIIKKIIGLAPLFVGIFVGIFPMLYTSIITSIICFFLNSYFPGKLLGYNSWMQICDIAPSFAITVTMALVVYFLKFMPMSYWIVLPIQIIVGLGMLIGLCKLSKSSEYEEGKEIALLLVQRFIFK